MRMEDIKEDLMMLLDYLWHDEERHYRERRSGNHVFLIIKRLAKEVGYLEFLKRGKCWKLTREDKYATN